MAVSLIEASETIGWASPHMLYPADGGRFYNGDMVFDRWPHFTRQFGKWSVGLCIGAEAAEFLSCSGAEAFAVMDDYGNLVRVS